ncbi:MAG: glycosyltransferase [Bacteroidota bacterium]
MTPCKRLLIRIPDGGTRRTAAACAIIKAANGFGVDAIFVAGGQSPEQHAELLEKYAPDVILEFGQSRNQAPAATPPAIRHICWLLEPPDTAAGTPPVPEQLFGGSDIVYTCGPPSRYGLDPRQHPESRWDILHPGADPDFFRPDPKARFVRNASFFDSVPPFDAELANQPFLSLGGRHLTHHELESCLVGDNSAVASKSKADWHRLILEKINHHFGLALPYEDFLNSVARVPAFKYFDDELPRRLGRERLLDAALPFGGLDIFGSPNWRSWPRYGRYYRDTLNWNTDIADIYRTSIVNLHDGRESGNQARSIDILACGGLLLACSTQISADPGLSRLIPGVHYLEVPNEAPENASNLLRHYIAHPEEARRIGMAGAEEIHARHLWRHRLQRMFSDLSAL